MLKETLRRVPLPILGITSVVILPLFAVYLTLSIFGVVVMCIFERDTNAEEN